MPRHNARLDREQRGLLQGALFGCCAAFLSEFNLLVSVDLCMLGLGAFQRLLALLIELPAVVRSPLS